MLGPTASELPFEQLSEGRIVVWADPEVVPPEGARDLLRLPGVLKGLRGLPSRSRAHRTVWRWRPSWLSGRRLVVRQFVHGGLLGAIPGGPGTLFLSARPMLRELRIALHASEHGVPTCRPVALRLERAFGPLLRAHYLSEEIPGAENLLELCRRLRRAAPCPRRRQALARGVARTVGALHQAGIRHDDLNLKNLLVASGQDPPRVYVIDFKKATLHDEVSLREGLRGLVRVDRSIVKWPASRRTVSVADRLRVLRDYVRLRSNGGSSWKEIARGIRTRHLLHAPGRK